MKQCSHCGGNYTPYMDRMKIIVDDVFVLRFGWSEYFGQADKIFVNAAPQSIYLDVMTGSTILIILDAFHSCPFCDFVNVDNTEDYYKKIYDDLRYYELHKRR